MAEAFSNKLTRAAGIVTSSTGGAIGVTTTIITGISTVGVAVSDLVVNSNFIAGTKITEIGASAVTVDRTSSNTAATTSQNVKFLGPTTAYTSASATKSILIGGSSFVISDVGKTLLEGTDEVVVYCDSANAIDANLSILTGVN